MLIVKGDLLESNCKYIAHSCNCITRNAAGLAKKIFLKYPYSDCYSNRFTYKSVRGSIDIRGDGLKLRYVINMFVQWFPGGHRIGDTKECRLRYFEECLNKISKIKDIESIGFPYGIGCGLGQGKWADYYSKIEDFANKIDGKTLIYKLN